MVFGVQACFWKASFTGCLGNMIGIVRNHFQRDAENHRQYRSAVIASGQESIDIAVRNKAAIDDHFLGEDPQGFELRIGNRAVFAHGVDDAEIEASTFGDRGVCGDAEVTFILDARSDRDDLLFQRRQAGSCRAGRQAGYRRCRTVGFSANTAYRLGTKPILFSTPAIKSRAPAGAVLESWRVNLAMIRLLGVRGSAGICRRR